MTYNSPLFRDFERKYFLGLLGAGCFFQGMDRLTGNYWSDLFLVGSGIFGISLALAIKSSDGSSSRGAKNLEVKVD